MPGFAFTQFNGSNGPARRCEARVVRRGVGVAVSIVLAAVEAMLVGVGAVAVTAATAGWPAWLSWVPADPVIAAWVCLGAAAVLAVVWVLRRGRLGNGVSAMLAGVEATLVGVGALAITAATANPPAWPAFMRWMPIAPVPAAVGSIVFGVVLAVTTVVWDARPAPADLTELFSPPPRRAESPAGLLRADQAVVRFRGEQRTRLLAGLRAWCAGGAAGVAVRIVAGGGGQGKTRLARELAATLPRGWVGGVVRADAPTEVVARLGRVRRPVLLVVDYAEARAGQIEALVAAVASVDVRVRLLLLARGVGEWRLELAARSAELEAVASCPVDELGPVETDLAGRQQAWREAVTDLAGRLHMVAGYRDVPWSKIAATVVAGPAPQLSGSRYGPVLAVHMHALASLLQASHALGAGDLTTEPAEEVLLRHEHRYWSITATAFGLAIQPTAAGGLTPATLRTAVAAASVFGARDRAEGLAIASRLPSLHDLGVHGHTAVAEWLATTYPQDRRWWGPLQPDPLGEHLAASVLRDAPDTFNAAASVASGEQWERALTVLSRAADTHPRLDHVIETLVTEHAANAVTAAVAVALEVVRPQPLLNALSQIVDTTADVDLLNTLNDTIPEYTQLHRDLARRVNAALVAVYRERADTTPDVLPDLAMSLNNLSVDLGDLGRREEGLAAIEEAVTVYRRLAQDRPDAFLPDLAASLNNLSVRLGDLGRREEGLAAIEEAVTIRRRLAQDRPDAFLPNLATSLNNLSLRLVDLGRREEGLAAIEEAVTIRRRLAQDRPDAFLPDLAMSLNNLSVDLGDLGRREEGLAAIEEAVTIRRRLAQDRPDAFLPNLATSLNNLSNRLGDLGRDAEAAVASEEAARIRAAHAPRAVEPA